MVTSKRIVGVAVVTYTETNKLFITAGTTVCITCVCVYVYVCLYVYIYVYMYICVHVCMCVYM